MNFDSEYYKAYYHARRQEYINYLGGKCVRCNSSKNLEFDHINREEKELNISRIIFYRWEVVKPELDKCQLLCEICHSIKTAKENSGYRHGTYYSWARKKCKCEICNIERRKFHETRNLKRRKESISNRQPYFIGGKLPPHGTTRRYSRKCRCDECKKANAKKAKRLRQQKKHAGMVK